MANAWVSIRVDGTTQGNPGPSAWGAVLQYGRSTKEVGGYLGRMTSNQAEVAAIIEAMKCITKNDQMIAIYSDSQYAVFCANGQYVRRSNHKFWKALDIEVKRHKKVIFSWVPREHNHQADRIASKTLKEHLKSGRLADPLDPEGEGPPF